MAGLLDDEPCSTVGAVADQRAQRRVQHDRRVVAEHALSRGVVAHQVFDAVPAVAREIHHRSQVRVERRRVVGRDGLLVLLPKSSKERSMLMSRHRDW
ncbi:hypothetical protein [Micromonospora sp. NPDC005324]|uniref:hypothetical protein n=1 Tax=Micromonospora sp. NPDC005324 TaxID=3157033 RepID=UPI0033BEDCDF